MGGTLLLDVDGVLIRNKPLLKHVKDNCVKYVGSKMPGCKNPELLNHILYLSHGHTARGLQNTFQVDAGDFNKEVYDRKLITHLHEFIRGDEFQQDTKEIQSLIDEGWTVSLFTNSPAEWVYPVADAIGSNVNVICPTRDLARAYMKPEASAYSQFPKWRDYIFIDDSLKNLGTSRWLPNWKPVQFTEEPKDPKSWCPQVSSIWEVALFSRSTLE
jgi:FMN phosphatase YigB (HAD superfamily)